MANSGYITNSGIQQVFTSGPFSGSVVSSSFISGTIVFGPAINFNQSFISGTVDNLSPCSTIFSRYYQDLITCPPNGCIPPKIISAAAICDPYNYQYNVSFNSGSTEAEYTAIEYSTTSDFSSNIGTYTHDNSYSSMLAVNVNDLTYLPTAYTSVYFRARNYCDVSSTSSYSGVITSTTCDIIIPATTTLTFNEISATEEDPQWQIYTIQGEPGTRVDYSTDALVGGNHGGIVYMINLADYTQKNLSFTYPTSGYYIIPASGTIQLQIFYSAKPSITGTENNCVSLQLTFTDLITSDEALSPAGLIELYVCDSY